VLGLDVATGGLERLELVAVEGVLLVVLGELGLECAVLVARLPARLELLRRARDAGLPPLAGAALGRRGQAREEVGNRLLLGALEAHVDEELLGLVDSAEEDTAPLVKDDRLGEAVVRRLRRLVDGDARDAARKLDRVADRLAERDGRRRVEAASRVVPLRARESVSSGARERPSEGGRGADARR